jgi:predicted transcriptional regulator
MPADATNTPLSRRERQIMDIVFRLGRASAAQIHKELPDPPHAAAVRTLLRILEAKGQLRHEKDGPRHVYLPVTPRRTAQRSAVRHLLSTFFDGSRTAAIAALLDDHEKPLSSSERRELDETLRRLRAEGR